MLDDVSAGIHLMGEGEFAFLAFLLVVLTGAGFYVWKKSFQHARVMEDMPTSKVRSAAQGFVELGGTQQAFEGTPLSAPLSHSACTWWSYQIEKKKRKRASEGGTTHKWVTVEKDTSVGFFMLRDDTGEILVNPRGADVTPSVKKVWYGDSKRPMGITSGFGGALGSRYRYTERIMLPGEPIYALGHFETWSNVADPTERSEKRAEILARWKKNPAELVERFDADGDGRVDMDEWDRARKAAEALVEVHVAKAAMKPDVDVLMNPEEDHPFILSTKSQEELTKRYRWQAVGGLLVFLASGVALGVSLTARFGG